ncbi:MAG TPA: glycosyltransferase family 4 protein [Longimicrobium sp.]|nr:glycosyltransferase family 4 protein [Longimicrobium sp.]
MPDTREPVVALVDFSQLVEDYLDNIGVSLDGFVDEMSGGWMFGYVAALRTAGVRTVLFVVSAHVHAPQRRRHAATGATVWVLPAPRAYRLARRRVLNPYAATVAEACGDVRGAQRALCAALLELSPYLSTPLAHLARTLRREGCRAVLCQDYEHGRLDACLLLARALGLPVFATFQGGDTSVGRLERLVRGPALRACDGLVIAAGREAERVRARYGVPERKIARVFNPLELDDWRPPTPSERAAARAALGIPADARVAAWHGRVLMELKGLDVLLDAWTRLADERPGRALRLLLVGTGNDRDALRRRVEGRTDVVWVDEYVRDRDRLRGYLAAADAWTLPSRREGFAVAPLEAMACGLPIVASDVAGIDDVLEGGEASGGLVVPRADAAALATALGRLLDDPALSRALGVRARERVERSFSPAAVGAQLRRVLLREGEASG